MGLLASLLVAAGCPADTHCIATFQARHVAAADAARAVNTFAVRTGLRAAAVADPVANTVRLEGEAAPVRRAAELLTDIDRRPPHVKCEMLFVRLPAGFAQAVGLGKSDGGRWVLTRREGDMLRAAIHRTVRHGAGAEYLSQPSVVTADNQTALCQVGHQGNDGLVTRITPRCGEDGSVVVRLDSQITESGPSGELTIHTTHFAQATAALTPGATVVIRVPSQSFDGRPATELLVLATAHRIADEAGR